MIGWAMLGILFLLFVIALNQNRDRQEKQLEKATAGMTKTQKEAHIENVKKKQRENLLLSIILAIVAVLAIIFFWWYSST